MSSKKIYLIRHGQTDFNLKNIVQGSGVNSSLNNTGRAQARSFFETYRTISFDKVYTSALIRTWESVQSFIDLGIPHEALAGLNEISWGTKEGFAITPDEDAYYHHMLKEWRLGNTGLKIEKGESPEEVVRRMKPALDHIISIEKEHTILICMHGRAIRILMCMIMDLPLKDMDTFEHQNLCLYLLNYDSGKYSIEKQNDVDHLRLLR